MNQQDRKSLDAIKDNPLCVNKAKSGVVILQIKNKSAPLHRLKIINLPQNQNQILNKNWQIYAKI